MRSYPPPVADDDRATLLPASSTSSIATSMPLLDSMYGVLWPTIRDASSICVVSTSVAERNDSEDAELLEAWS